MNRIKTSRVLKLLILSFAVLGLFILSELAPTIWNRHFQELIPKVIYSVFIAISAIPYFSTLSIAWSMLRSYEEDRFINADNVRLIKIISYCSLFEFILYSLATLVLIVTKISIGIEGNVFIVVILLASALLTIALSIFSTVLYETVHLKEESELTI